MMTTLQFVAALVAALLGEFVTRFLLRLPVTSTRFAVMGGYWSLAILSYLVPRSASRVLRTRLLACVLILSVLAYGLFLFAEQLRFAVALAIILAPLCSILVFCTAAFLTGTGRSWTGAAAVLVPTLTVHFVALWWSYGFRGGFAAKLAAVQLIPLLAATASLLATDRLMKTGSSPVGRPETDR